MGKSLCPLCLEKRGLLSIDGIGLAPYKNIWNHLGHLNQVTVGLCRVKATEEQEIEFKGDSQF